VVLAEMNLRQLLSGDTIGHADFLARAHILHVLGIDVLISRFQPYYQLADYLAVYTDQMIGIAVGMPTIRDVLDEQYYQDLSGGALESIGRLFKRSVKLYVYPMSDPSTGQIISVENAPVPRPGSHIRDLLLEMGHLVPLGGYEPRYLSIRTPDVLALLQKGDASWEDLVLPEVAQVIKNRKLLGYGG